MKFRKIKLSLSIKKPVLGLGAHTKNTISFIYGDTALISPVRADLGNLQDFLSFQKTARYFLKKNPKIVAYDLHPEYQSTKYAQQLSAIRYTLSAIQHHHAHIASCMAENGLKNQKVIGVAFDGTGLGKDNTLWGAEFFLCDYRDFTRVAHLKEIPLLGGEKAILEPARLTACWLYSIYKDKFLDFFKGLDKNKWHILKKMYLTGFNSSITSSMGRLFDAASVLILGKDKARFEAELAIELERKAVSRQLSAASYKFSIKKDKKIYILDPSPMFKEIIADLKAKMPKGEIAYRFHLTVAEMIRKTCRLLRKRSNINKVVLSGGVFQNNLLLSAARDLLYKEGFKVITHKNISCNDSGISLGESVIANFNS